MDPFDEDDDEDKKKRDPFDDFNFDDDFFDDIMENIFNNILENDKIREDIRRMTEEIMKNNQNNKPFVHGFKVDIGPDGRPHIKDLNQKRNKRFKRESEISEDDISKPSPDVIEGSEIISVTVSIPGVKKEDIDLKVSQNSVRIKVNSYRNRYDEKVNLPCPVKPKTTKASYKNGVLDITIKKRQKKKIDNGYNIKID
ncbi:MAG: Hsp20/alpha crystallin family protein [Candidatus Thermoplasmatota archaeon]